MASDSVSKAQKASSVVSSLLVRKVQFYLLLASLLADAYASDGSSLMHLTLWSWILHLLYFELPLFADDGSEKTNAFLCRLFHGPSLSGSAALFAMYIWTLVANPNMEYDLAPEGRAEWLILARAFWLHVSPVAFHALDLAQNGHALRRNVYGNGAYAKSYLLWFWASVGGYFAMGLTWEQVNGDASETYNVTLVTPEVYVLVGKVVGVSSCIVAFLVVTMPLLSPQ